MRLHHHVVASVAACLLLFLLPGLAPAQYLTTPQPGDIYREFTQTMSTGGNDWRVTDPNASNPGSPGNSPADYLPNAVLNLTINDLQGAVRAEAVLDLWGGHVGTTSKRLRFNGNSWITIPEIATTPTSGQCYTSVFNPVVPIPLNNLVQGSNSFEGTSGGQTCYGFDWGQWGWYAITVRVYYNSSKAHATGSITSPTTGGSFGENPLITATTSGSVQKVDFLAYYDGYDTDGDGVYQQYHEDYHRGPSESTLPVRNHVGTATSSPYQVTWNTDLVPDQVAGSVKLLARITDNNGVVFVTNEVTNLSLQRSGTSVKLYKAVNVPESYWVRDSQVKSSGFTIPPGDNLANATAAKLLVRTWNGIDGQVDPGQTHYTKVNSFTTPEFGGNHFYSFDVLSVPTSALTSNANTVTFSSQTSHHGIEVCWPGPAMLVRYNVSGGTGPQIVSHPANQSVGVGQTATFSVTATGSSPLAFQWQKGTTNISGATGSSYTTPATTLADNGSTYRCVVSNGSGNVTSNSATLTVSSSPPPSGIVSDDFSAGTLNGALWSFVNPKGDATVGFVGAGTQNVQLSLAIPAGVSHDFWSDGFNSPRLMQNAPNGDFEVEAKFDATMSAAYQFEGIIVQQDAQNLLRFDFVNDGAGVRFFAASFASGSATVQYDSRISVSAPLYLRVRRQGNAWLASYSTNGTAWTPGPSFTLPFTVTAVGPYAGNHGIPASATPAFTALVDYFFNTASPIVPEDGGASQVVITQQPASQTVTVGQTATFTVGATGPAPLSYQWFKNSTSIGGATSASYTTPATTLADNGAQFQCYVSNGSGNATSTPAVLTVQAVAASLLTNPGFESGTAPWSFYTNGGGSFADDAAGPSSAHAGHMTITGTGTNVQLFQSGITLKENTAYRLTFMGKSNTGHDLTVSLRKHVSPYTSYGFLDRAIDLTSSWALYTIDFTTSGFSGTVSDGRLMFWLAGAAVGGDQYFLDDITLTEATATTPTSFTLQPANQSVAAGQTATFSVAVTGTPPFSYQWRKNSSDIPGATAASYTTPATVKADSGSLFACFVTGLGGSVLSNSARLSVTSGGSTPPGWWNTSWHFRVPITVGVGAVARTDKPVVVPLNFTQLLSQAGGSGALILNSLRLIEVTSGGSVLNASVPFQFDQNSGFDPTTNAAGSIVFLLNGSTAANATRYYHVYFDTQGSFSAPVFGNQVTVADNPAYEGQAAFVITTSAATYYYHKQGGGFASLIDNNGNDWISFHATVGSGAGGEYRGIPNMGDVFHPGYTSSTSTLLSQGPLRARIATQSTDGTWRCEWEIFPNYAHLTLLANNANYWFLYEGTPGGALDVNSDFLYRSSGTRNLVSDSWTQDLGAPEWVYFGDRSLRRVLYAVHHEDDSQPDYYRQMDNLMTVFGFGRQDPCCTRYMSAVPQNFTVGFAEDSTFATASGVIEASYRPLSASVGVPEASSGGNPPPSGIVSDNFNGGSLNTSLWTLLNPVGDASASVASNHLAIAVPAGTSHDLWPGNLSAPRLLQPAPNGDFEVEAKFDGAFSAQYQFQGIVAQQDNQNLVRTDFVYDAVGPRFFAATIAGSNATVQADTRIALASPLYLRLKRQGNAWTASYSNDGSSWTVGASFTQALTLSTVGPYAGNHGIPVASTPAFTAQVDYFFNTAAPLGTADARADRSLAEEEQSLAPKAFALRGNYPNPFNPTTLVRYELPRDVQVRLTVYDVLGREVAVLVDGMQKQGSHEARFDASRLASGMYICLLRAGEFTATSKMLLTK